MVDEGLLKYIKREKDKSTNQDQIYSNLTKLGWQTDVIDEAFSILSVPNNLPPLPNNNSFNNHRDNLSSSISLKKTKDLLKDAFSLIKDQVSDIFLIYTFSILTIAIPVIVTILAFNLKNLTFEIVSILSVLLGFYFLVKLNISLRLLLIKSISFKEAFNLSKGKFFRFFFSVIAISLVSSIPILNFFTPIWFAFTSIIILDEDTKIVESMLISKFYIKGYFIKIVGRFIFFWFITSLFSFVTQLIFKDWFGRAISTLISYLFTLPFYIAVYKNIKEIKSTANYVPTSKSKNILRLLIFLGPVFAVIVFLILFNNLQSFLQAYPIPSFSNSLKPF